MNHHDYAQLTPAEREAVRAGEKTRRENTAAAYTGMRDHYDQNPPANLRQRVPFTTRPDNPEDADPGMQRMAAAYDQAGIPTREDQA